MPIFAKNEAKLVLILSNKENQTSICMTYNHHIKLQSTILTGNTRHTKNSLDDNRQMCNGKISI